MRLVVSIALLLGAVACHSSFALRDRSELRRDVAQHEAKWRGLGLHYYAFEYDLDSRVNPPRVRIDVMADTVAHVVVVETGQELPVAGWPTVDSLFAELDGLAARPDVRLTVTYDPGLGFPTHITGLFADPVAQLDIQVDHLYGVAFDRAHSLH